MISANLLIISTGGFSRMVFFYKFGASVRHTQSVSYCVKKRLNEVAMMIQSRLTEICIILSLNNEIKDRERNVAMG